MLWPRHLILQYPNIHLKGFGISLADVSISNTWHKDIIRSFQVSVKIHISFIKLSAFGRFDKGPASIYQMKLPNSPKPKGIVLHWNRPLDVSNIAKRFGSFRKTDLPIILSHVHLSETASISDTGPASNSVTLFSFRDSTAPNHPFSGQRQLATKKEKSTVQLFLNKTFPELLNQWHHVS